MTPDEALEKIMEAADEYNRFEMLRSQWISKYSSQIVYGSDKDVTEDLLEAQRESKRVRSELEQVVKAVIFALTKGGE